MEEGFKDVKTLTNKSVLPSGLLMLRSRWYLSISDAGAKEPSFRQMVHHGAEWELAAQRRVSITMLLQLLPAEVREVCAHCFVKG